MQLLKSLGLLACLAVPIAAEGSGAMAFIHAHEVMAEHSARMAARAEAAEAFQAEQRKREPIEKRQSVYLNPMTEKFVVNPYGLPDVKFGIGESYAGLLPISDKPDEDRKLFFWFFPSTNPAASDEITMWFNGGPGCSSLSGLLTENGPFTWEAGTFKPTQNPYSWNNLTNMLWVEQPVGVGFTQGTPNIAGEPHLADELLGFYKSFVDAFKVYGRKVYLTGESYGGFYVPYIANNFLHANDKKYYNLAGVAINDPIIGDFILQQEIPIAPYVDYWAHVMNLNSSFTKEMHALDKKCGYEAYRNKYLTFPPPGPLPKTVFKRGCDIFTKVFNAALNINPCFNIYHILDTCPFKWSVMGIVNRGESWREGRRGVNVLRVSAVDTSLG